MAQEIYGDAVTYVKRGAVKETADALIRLLTSRADADAQLARAPAVLARYSWATSAERTLAVLEEVARR